MNINCLIADCHETSSLAHVLSMRCRWLSTAKEPTVLAGGAVIWAPLAVTTEVNTG